MSGAAARPPTDRELRLQALRRRFLAEAAAEHLELERLLAAGLEVGSAPARRFRKVVHDLRGSGGSYGYPGITAAAERLEERLRDGGEPAALAAELAALGAAIDRAGERSEPVDRAPPPPAAGPGAGGAPGATPGEAGWGPIAAAGGP